MTKNRELTAAELKRIERGQDLLAGTKAMRAARELIRATTEREPNQPTPERAAKDKIIEEETISAGTRKRRVTTQRPLDRYLDRGQISKHQYDAGDRLSRAYHAAGGLVRVTGSYGVRVDGSPRRDVPRQVEAMEELNRAMGYVGVQLSPILIGVCLMDEHARDWATRREENPDSGIVVLRVALDRLVEWYAKPRSHKKPLTLPRA